MPDTGKLPILPDSPPPARSGPEFRVSAGAGWRTGGGVTFQSGGSRSGRLRLPFLAVAGGHQASATGDQNAYADRDYRDGFVYQDAGTPGDGSTWNWGYSSASQLKEGNSLSFHGQGVPVRQAGTASSEADAGSWSDDGGAAVPVVQLDCEWEWKPGLAAGISLQYSFLDRDGGHTTQSFFSEQVQSTRSTEITDRYPLGDVIAPEAPYAGSYGGPGPLIDNLPGVRTISDSGELGSSRVVFFNRVSGRFDVQLHRIAIGPSISASGPRGAVSLGGGLALNIADWSATRTETLFVKRSGQAPRTYRRWQDHQSGTDLLTGAYLQASGRVTLTPHLALTGFCSYDWSRSLTAAVGPSAFRVDPTGWTVGGMLSFTF